MKSELKKMFALALVFLSFITFMKVEAEEPEVVVEPQSMTVFKKNLNITPVKQENNYYCGPASAHMVIRFVQNKSVSQSTLASQMGTNINDGTIVYKLRDGINNHTTYKYKYSLVSNVSLLSTIRSNIENNKPLIAHVFPNTLNPKYSKNYTGHYVVIKGYEYRVPGTIPEYSLNANESNETYANPNYPKLVTYIDPWLDATIFGERTVEVSVMESAIKNRAGYFIH